MPSLPELNAAHRRFVVIETLIPSLLNGVMPGVGIWLFGTGGDIALWGKDGVAGSMILPTFMPSLIMPVIVTLIVRMRVRNGSVAGLAQAFRDASIIRFMPNALWARSLWSTILPLFLLLPMALFSAHGLGLDPMSHSEFIILNVICGTGAGILILPPIILTALCDGIKAVKD